MPCPQPCSNCQSQGLPILFTRYAAAYSAREDGMAALQALRPGGSLAAQPGGVPIRTATYGVRMLREGYLYVLVERKGLMPEWQGHVVGPQGYLSAFDIRHPTEAQAHPACEVDMRGAAKSMVWIADARRVTGLWYLFHPDPIQYTHLTQVIQKRRGTCMHKLDVAAWLEGSTDQKHTLPPARLEAQVLEFAAMEDDALQLVGNEQYYGLMGRTPQERGWGDYEVAQTSRYFEETGGGAATGPAVRPSVRAVRQLPYHAAHGRRLNNITAFLTQKQGAVAVCDDAIGIAQELSLHHLTAAIPYVGWLKETDVHGVSNQWKQAASESIRTVRAALARSAVAAYDDETDRMRDMQDVMLRGYPGSDGKQSVRLRRPDGTDEEISLQELNRRRAAEVGDKVASRESDRPIAAVQAANRHALDQTSRYCDMQALSRFDALHLQQLKMRDERMDLLAADLHAWLRSDAFVEGALGCYDETADIDTGDGARCAGQLCAILLQIDSAPRGRAWYAALDLFTPGKKNLVWRMLSLNNAEISAELQAALAAVANPLPVAGLETTDAEEWAARLKACKGYLDALAQLTKTLSASDKISKGLPKVLDSGLKRLERLQAAGELAKVVYDSPHAVLSAAVVARFKALPASRGESLIAKAQLLLLGRGLGSEAVAFTKQLQADALSGKLAKQARYTQRQVDKAIRQQIATVAGRDMRMANVLLALNTFAILPALARAAIKRDERTMTELAGSLASLIGGVRQWRADLYEKGLYKQLPETVYKTHKEGMSKATAAELLRLKTAAAHFVAAGAVVGVVWDAVDMVKAYREDESLLAASYFGRVLTGGAAIGGVVVGARYVTAPLLLIRFNYVTAFATAALTAAIGKLKGDAWANWLQAQPFHAALIATDGTPERVENRSIQPMRENTKLLYRSEKEMMDKLADALAEIE